MEPELRLMLSSIAFHKWIQKRYPEIELGFIIDFDYLSQSCYRILSLWLSHCRLAQVGHPLLSLLDLIKGQLHLHLHLLHLTTLPGLVTQVIHSEFNNFFFLSPQQFMASSLLLPINLIIAISLYCIDCVSILWLRISIRSLKCQRSNSQIFICCCNSFGFCQYSYHLIMHGLVWYFCIQCPCNDW
jgi:hypothetical protein